MPSAAAIEAMRPPIDLPPANTRRRPARETPSANASRQASISTGGRSGARRPACMYGNSNRRVATPRRPISSAKPSMNGARMPEPAPWASTSTVSAPAGSIHMGGIVRLRGRGVAGLGPVALGPAAGKVVRLRPPRRLLDRDRLRLGDPEVAQDVADRVL